MIWIVWLKVTGFLGSCYFKSCFYLLLPPLELLLEDDFELELLLGELLLLNDELLLDELLLVEDLEGLGVDILGALLLGEVVLVLLGVVTLGEVVLEGLVVVLLGLGLVVLGLEVLVGELVLTGVLLVVLGLEVDLGLVVLVGVEVLTGVLLVVVLGLVVVVLGVEFIVLLVLVLGEVTEVLLEPTLEPNVDEVVAFPNEVFLVLFFAIVPLLVEAFLIETPSTAVPVYVPLFLLIAAGFGTVEFLLFPYTEEFLVFVLLLPLLPYVLPLLYVLS